MMSRKSKAHDRHWIPCAAAASRSNPIPEAPQTAVVSDDGRSGPDPSAGGATDSRLVRLDEAVTVLDSYLWETVIPTGRIINPLLDVWDAAHSIAADVSSPVEQLLTTLVSRHLITPTELVCVLDKVRVAALQATVLLDQLATV